MIDWKNKPEGAQRYNNKIAYKWLKRDGDIVSYYCVDVWVVYDNKIVGIKMWNKATVEQPPLQLTWKDAPAKATHILQQHVSSKQEFARNDNDKILVDVDDDNLFYNMDKWFIVSEAPVIIDDSGTQLPKGWFDDQHEHSVDILNTV